MRDFQCLTLVAAGNAALRGADIGRFWPDAAVFRWTEQVEFVIPRGEERFDLIAADPLAWFDWLRGRCEGLRLHTAPMQQDPKLGPISERMLAGFVGGGPRWLIEALGPQRSQLWEGYDRLGDRAGAANRIWRTAYLMQGETARLDAAADADVAAGMTDLSQALDEVESVGRAIGAANFAEIFAGARAALRGDITDAHDLGAPLNEPAARLVAAAMRASVFGGMGSWNDVGAPPEHQVRYDRASEALFAALQRAVTCAANSTYTPSRAKS